MQEVRYWSLANRKKSKEKSFTSPSKNSDEKEKDLKKKQERLLQSFLRYLQMQQGKSLVLSLYGCNTKYGLLSERQI